MYKETGQLNLLKRVEIFWGHVQKIENHYYKIQNDYANKFLDALIIYIIEFDLITTACDLANI